MIFTYIKADAFFPKYCPSIKNFKHKIRGKNGRGNPIEFTRQEWVIIKKGIRQLANEV